MVEVGGKCGGKSKTSPTRIDVWITCFGERLCRWVRGRAVGFADGNLDGERMSGIGEKLLDELYFADRPRE